MKKIFWTRTSTPPPPPPSTCLYLNSIKSLLNWWQLLHDFFISWLDFSMKKYETFFWQMPDSLEVCGNDTKYKVKKEDKFRGRYFLFPYPGNSFHWQILFYCFSTLTLFCGCCYRYQGMAWELPILGKRKITRLELGLKGQSWPFLFKIDMLWHSCLQRVVSQYVSVPYHFQIHNHTHSRQCQ